MTINSNQPTNHEGRQIQIGRALEDLVNRGLSQPDGLEFIQDVGHEVGRGRKATQIPEVNYNDESVVQDVSTRLVTEIGDKGFVHAHYIIKITHTTRIFFNRLKIKQYYQAFMEQNYPDLGLHISKTGGKFFPNVKVDLLGNVREGGALKDYFLKSKLLPGASLLSSQ